MREATRRAELQREVRHLFAHYGETAVKMAVQAESEREESMLSAYLAARKGDDSKMRQHLKRWNNGRV